MTAVFLTAAVRGMQIYFNSWTHLDLPAQRRRFLTECTCFRLNELVFNIIIIIYTNKKLDPLFDFYKFYKLMHFIVSY
jgi:hypothetical protein